MDFYKNLSVENLSAEINGITYNEEWANIINCNGLYEISNFGRLKRAQREYYSGKHLSARKIVSQGVVSQTMHNGYLSKSIYIVKAKVLSVHRTVAQYFVANPNNKKEVNHIDGKKDNNFFMNLEWVTHQENLIHARDVLGVFANKKYERTKGMTPVLKLNKKMEVVAEYFSAREAERENNIFSQNIGMCCNNPNKTAGGFYWRFKN